MAFLGQCTHNASNNHIVMHMQSVQKHPVQTDSVSPTIIFRKGKKQVPLQVTHNTTISPKLDLML